MWVFCFLVCVPHVCSDQKKVLEPKNIGYLVDKWKTNAICLLEMLENTREKYVQLEML